MIAAPNIAPSRRARPRKRRTPPFGSALLLLLLLLLTPPRAGSAEYAAECRAVPDQAHPVTITVDHVECQRLYSAAIGGVTAFSYYVPSACAVNGNCPVLYVMHGTGGDYRSYYVLGRVDAATSPPLAAALTKGPSVDVTQVSDPWNHGDPSTWADKPAIDMVLIAPNNRTVPGGYGPTGGSYSDGHFDGLWSDWNPKYASGSVNALYDTPPPLFDTMVADELLRFVDDHFPVGHGREYRATWGISQGGLGALIFPLQHRTGSASCIRIRAHPSRWGIRP